MSELDHRVTDGAAEVLAAAEMPKTFMLVGEGGPDVLGVGRMAGEVWVVDAEGVVLRDGSVYAWCSHNDCCRNPRRWPSVDHAAECHGSLILHADGTLRVPFDGEDDAGTSREG